jgi:hypothetical protein
MENRHEQIPLFILVPVHLVVIIVVIHDLVLRHPHVIIDMILDRKQMVVVKLLDAQIPIRQLMSMMMKKQQKFLRIFNEV